MICFSVNSGSNGNCIYVEAGGVRLLFDAGISGKRVQDRLTAKGRDVRDVQAVVISHDHSDHVRCAGILHRKFGLPVYMTPGTHRAAGACGIGPIADLRTFRPGQTLEFGPVQVEAIGTPHDAAEPHVFVIAADGKRLGILTDLGCVFAGLPELLGSLDAVFLESNYDPAMLANGPYPDFLKRRIAGDSGHISNQESAELVRTSAGARLQWVALSHLSEVNNTPELAERKHREIVGNVRTILVAPRYDAGPILHVE
jgi:phosphoribosyl 1,2-cyclic phosphodiesterase